MDDFEAKRLTEQEANDQFYQLRQFASDIEALYNRLHIRKIKALYNNADTQTRDYFKQYHS